jgi:hypothetical protein
MKILTIVMMMAAMTSVYAGECKLNDTCASEADCKNLNKDYSFSGGKCINVKAGETDTKCADIVSSSQAKGSTKDAAAAAKDGSDRSK